MKSINGMIKLKMKTIQYTAIEKLTIHTAIQIFEILKS